MRWLSQLDRAASKGRTYMGRTLWRRDAHETLKVPGPRLLVFVLRAAYLVWFGFSRERLRLRAAALTYMTLLSLVPALAVVFSLFTAFGDLKQAGDHLKEQIVGWIAIGQQNLVVEHLDRFVGSAHAGALGAAGVGVLLLTALSLLTNVERAFNQIWGLTEDRSFLRRFRNYFPMLTLGPVLFGVSLTATASIESSLAAQKIVQWFPAAESVFRLGPILLTWCGFALAYLILPNTRVKVRYAFAASIAAGTLWEIAKRVFAVYAAKAIHYSAIYGPFAVVPLSLIWLYVSWMIVLSGALLTYATQNAHSYEPAFLDDRLESDRERLRTALKLMISVYGRFERGQGTTTVAALLDSVFASARLKRALLRELNSAGLLVFTDDEGVGPARPAHKVTLADMVDAIRGAPDGPDTAQVQETSWLSGIEYLDVADATARQRLETVTFADLIATEATE